MELVLVRHALPHRLVVPGGVADPELSPEGRRQAAALGRVLATEPLHAVYASPLRRAEQTAAPVAAAVGLTPRRRDGLAEWDRDAADYIPVEELKATGDPRWDALAAQRWDELGVDIEAFRRRVLTTVAAIAADHPGERVAVVCHGGVINVVAADVLGLEQVLFFEPAYTSLTRVLVARDGTRSLRSLNEAGHLLHPPA
ncbi:MAG: histidine phosphatase family protein [Acidimicrobiales bacterium]|jgi:probable phosphoglycerate mutase|nr:histidine phosphatase family protein [Acidimicrobiales bacterium]